MKFGFFWSFLCFNKFQLSSKPNLDLSSNLNPQSSFHPGPDPNSNSNPEHKLYSSPHFNANRNPVPRPNPNADSKNPYLFDGLKCLYPAVVFEISLSSISISTLRYLKTSIIL